MTKFKKMKQNKAFTFIEFSIILIVIGIMLAGIVQGQRMIAKFRLQAAQALTLSSPVINIKGLSLWLEATLSENFDQSQIKDGAQLTIWNDRNPQAIRKLYALATASTGITYKKVSEINGLPSVYFNGSSSALFKLSTSSSSVVETAIPTPNNAFSFFIVARLVDDASTSLKAVFSNGGSSDGWGYALSGVQGSRTRTITFPGASNVSVTTANASTVTEVISATHMSDISGGEIKLFTNGIGAAGSGAIGSTETLASSMATAKNPTTGFYIGNYSTLSKAWSGYISEIIIFNRLLSEQERKMVEKYLGQKYSVKVLD